MTAAIAQRVHADRRLVETGLVRADVIVACHEDPPSGEISGQKLVVTYSGAFEFQVGGSRTWVDSGRILFAHDGESYVDHHVVAGVGHASVVLTPSAPLVDELWGKTRTGRVRGGSLRAQLLAQRLRRTNDPLEAEETAVALMEESVAGSRPVSAVDQRCVRLAKAALLDCEDGRVTLEALAVDIGVTPVHLTQCFRKSEGLPLYRYQTQLRLGRALELLPESEDITDLALSLGFSSHSHFTAAFRANIGMTPSQYRGETRQ